MFGFFKRKADVLEHWIASIEGFQLESSEFYDSVEKELKARQVPGMEMSRVEFAEGGILSDKRTYLRMVRERWVFDVCAAPFGTNFFFSCRFAEIPAVVRFWHLLVLVGALGVLGLHSLGLAVKFFGVAGILLCPVAWILLLALLIYVMRNSAAMGLKNLDATLIKIPVIGPLYEALIRKETYYRHDTRLMYLYTVSGIVKRLAEEAVAAKGLKLAQQFEQAPIFSVRYKPVPPANKPEAREP